MSNFPVLFLTATIKAGSYHFVGRPDFATRENDYLKALEFYKKSGLPILFVDNSLFIHPSHEIMLDTEFAVPTFFKLLPFVFPVSLSILSVLLSEFLPKLLINFKFSRFGYNIFSFFNQRFYIELFYNKYITKNWY